MKKLASIFAPCLVVAGAGLSAAAEKAPAPKAAKVSPAAPVKKKTMLFDGKSLNGWVRYLPKKEEIEDNWSAQEGVLRCEGKMVGYIRTKKSYGNYKLHLEWRWPEKASNSGVLLHVQGKDTSFPRCIEAQLKSGNAGDLVMMSGGALTIEGKRIKAKKEIGRWNTYEIICQDGAIKLIVNGVVQNEGEKADPASGYIGLQSEGAPIEFRNIYVEPVE